MMIEIDETREVTSLTSEGQVITLDEFIEQLVRLRGYRYPAQAWQEVLEAGASRIGQLHRYKLKRGQPDSKFRPYKPLKLSATERGNVERAARAEGIATLPEDGWRCQYFIGPSEETGTVSRRCLAPAGHSGTHQF